MADRETLIARKHEVRRAVAKCQRELEQLRRRSPLPARKVARLEDQVERLMAEEYNLRLAIDRSPVSRSR